MMTFLLKRSKPKKSLARTSLLAKKQCAPARRIRILFWRIPLRILGEIQAKHSGRAFGTPTHWLVQSLLVLFWCVYCTKLEPIFKTKTNRTRGARDGSELNRTLHESPATASFHSATPKRKNVPCFPDFRGVDFF